MPAGSRGEASRERLFVSLKNLIVTLLAIGKTRAELLVTEVEEASALRRQVAQPSRLFRASLAELEADMAQLRGVTDKQ